MENFNDDDPTLSIEAKRERLKKWREQRGLMVEVQNNGGEVVRSKGKWASFDQGNGVMTQGVFNCVGLAATGEGGFVAHIAAGRKPVTETGPDSMPNFIDQAIAKGVKEIKVFGIRDKMTEDILNYLKERGIKTELILNEDNNDAFTIVVKGDKLEYWEE